MLILTEKTGFGGPPQIFPTMTWRGFGSNAAAAPRQYNITLTADATVLKTVIIALHDTEVALNSVVFGGQTMTNIVPKVNTSNRGLSFYRLDTFLTGVQLLVVNHASTPAVATGVSVWELQNLNNLSPVATLPVVTAAATTVISGQINAVVGGFLIAACSSNDGAPGAFTWAAGITIEYDSLIAATHRPSGGSLQQTSSDQNRTVQATNANVIDNLLLAAVSFY